MNALAQVGLTAQQVRLMTMHMCVPVKKKTKDTLREGDRQRIIDMISNAIASGLEISAGEIQEKTGFNPVLIGRIVSKMKAQGHPIGIKKVRSLGAVYFKSKEQS